MSYKNLRHKKPIFSARETAEFERYSIKDLGIPTQLLIESAGLVVAECVLRSYRKIPNAKVLIMVGTGNNGRDALVAARHLLAHDIPLEICLIEPATNNYIKEELKLLKAFPLKIYGTEHLKKSIRPLLIIDGIFGAGLNRAPMGAGLLAIDFINQHGREIISIDIPSGLSLDAKAPLGAHVRAHQTITFQALKRAHISEPTKASCGKVKASNIGLFKNSKPGTWWIDKQKCLTELLLPYPSPCHKGQFGHVLILEGHPQFLGASRLAAHAALRVGAGLLSIASSNQKQNLDPLEYMHVNLLNIEDKFLRSLSSVVIGPGLSQDLIWQNHGLNLLNRLSEHDLLIVLDADGLLLLKHSKLVLKNQFIGTPHPKEAARLLDCSTEEIESDRFLAINKLSKTFGGAWLLKGETPLVKSLEHEIYAFKGDQPVLSAGGMGDILSGTIAGLYKQTASPIEALMVAVSLQLEAAKLLSKNVDKGILASELADQFPYLLRR